jgi:Fic family protein
VVRSSEIEGEKLDSDQVRSSIARRLGMDVGGLVPTARDVEGVVEMMLDATTNYAQPLTADRLFGWHAALFPTGRIGLQKITVGNWRDDSGGPMQVVSGPTAKRKVHYEAPPAARVPEDMDRFLSWFEAPGKIDPLLIAGLAHVWFVTIHPFDDGNGRIARAIEGSQDTAYRDILDLVERGALRKDPGGGRSTSIRSARCLQQQAAGNR